jgi:hypothetical protein
MKTLISISLLALLSGTCSSQIKKPEYDSKPNTREVAPSKPKIDVKVNKQFDKKGNLIQYDSTYSYFYSAINPKANRISSDSLFQKYKIPLNNHFKELFDENMKKVFFTDSLFKYDFYNPDYFSKRFHMNWEAFEKMFKQMDSLKAGMFQQSFPKENMRRKQNTK